uniref:DUF659 domain-containing protein n=1 Tax=Bursaphelenchus xylophilus TaxID=6326 RepID=A0A1I7SUN9_BURXY
MAAGLGQLEANQSTESNGLKTRPRFLKLSHSFAYSNLHSEGFNSVKAWSLPSKTLSLITAAPLTVSGSPLFLGTYKTPRNRCWTPNWSINRISKIPPSTPKMPAISEKVVARSGQKMRTKTHLPFIKAYYDPHPTKPITFVCRFCGVTYSGGHSFRMLAHLLPPNHPYGKKKPCQKVDARTRNEVVDNCRVYLQAREASRGISNSRLFEDYTTKTEEPSTSKSLSLVLSETLLSTEDAVEDEEEEEEEKMIIEEKVPLKKDKAENGNNFEQNALQTMLSMVSNLNKSNEKAAEKAKTFLTMGLASGEIPSELMGSDYFSAFIRTVFKDFSLPSKSEIRSGGFIQSEYQKGLEEIKSFIERAKYLHVSLDCWSDINGDSVAGIIVHTPTPYLYKIVAATESDFEKKVVTAVIRTFNEIGVERVVSFINENSGINTEKIVRNYPWILSPPMSMFNSQEMEGICQNLQSCFQVPSEIVQAGALVQLLDPTSNPANFAGDLREETFAFIREKYGEHPEIDAREVLNHLDSWVAREDTYSLTSKANSEAWRPKTFKGDYNPRNWWNTYFEGSPLANMFNMLVDIPPKSLTDDRKFDLSSYVAKDSSERALTDMKIFLKYNHMLTFHRQTARKTVF